MIHKTKGIVLRCVKYGETSIIVTIFTELFGIQSYLVNGVRTSAKTSMAHFFQPSSMLEMQVYHNELKNLQRIKETRWSYLYRHVLSDIIKNAVAMYLIELLYKCIKQPEQNTDLFNFIEDSMLALDSADEKVVANFPLYFSMQLAHFFGFRLTDNYSSMKNIFDLQEGNFIDAIPSHPYFIDVDTGNYFSQLLKAMHPDELSEITINRAMRKNMLTSMELYYGLHVQDFGVMKTLPVLYEILS